MSAWWSRILPWSRERPVPYTPREPVTVADWSDIAVTEEDRKALGEAFRRARASSTARVALREVLALFAPVTVCGRIAFYQATEHPIHPDDMDRWRKALGPTEADYEALKTRWREAYGKPGAAHVVTEIHATEPRDSSALDRVRALEARLWEATDGRTMPVSAVCHSIANDLRFALNPPPEEDDPPVQCWHTEPGTPCDWDVCRQPERLAAGDRGTDPARKEPS